MNTHRSTPAFAVGFVAPLFACMVCGEDTATYPAQGIRGICEKHCFDHDFEYDRYLGGHHCVHCDAEREYEPCDDDLGFGGGFSFDAPIGIPASAMDGNAMKGGDKWDRWVAFCNSCGHP